MTSIKWFKEEYFNRLKIQIKDTLTDQAYTVYSSVVPTTEPAMYTTG